MLYKENIKEVKKKLVNFHFESNIECAVCLWLKFLHVPFDGATL